MPSHCAPGQQVWAWPSRGCRWPAALESALSGSFTGSTRKIYRRYMRGTWLPLSALREPSRRPPGSRAAAGNTCIPAGSGMIIRSRPAGAAMSTPLALARIHRARHPRPEVAWLPHAADVLPRPAAIRPQSRRFAHRSFRPGASRRNRWRASCWETSPRGSDRGLGKGPAFGGHLASGLPVLRAWAGHWTGSTSWPS
jgi:hypothetical protein